MPNPLRFILVWIACLLALGGVVVAVNYIVDPYEVFGTPRYAHINLLKPAAKNHPMLAKTYQVGRARPATVLIGSSPTYLGMDANDPAWPASLQPVYNYGIPGNYAPSVGLQTLREAIAVGDVRQAIVIIDFQNFLVPERMTDEPTEDDRRFHLLTDGSPNPHRPRQIAEDMFLALFSMTALADSAGTVLRQYNPDTLNLAPNGTATESDFANAARWDGMHDLFSQKADSEAESAILLARGLVGWQGTLPNLTEISHMIDLAIAHQVKLTLVIAPHHASSMELYWRAGLWPRVEELKEQLAEMVTRKDHGVVLWDFMDYSPYSTESVPPAGDRHTPTKWFWEATHFKKPLGHLIIARINGASSPDFGAILTPGSVAARNAEVRAQRDAVVCQNGEDFLMTDAAKGSDDGCNRAIQTARQPG
jgi:hypothetical protein